MQRTEQYDFVELAKTLWDKVCKLNNFAPVEITDAELEELQNAKSRLFRLGLMDEHGNLNNPGKGLMNEIIYKQLNS